MMMQYEQWKFNAYDSHPNPYQLLTRSVGLPFFIGDTGRCKWKVCDEQCIESNSRTGTSLFPNQDVEKNQTITYHITPPDTDRGYSEFRGKCSEF